MKQSNNIPQNKQCNLHIVRRSFLGWVAYRSPDYVSKIVLSNLLNKYQNGDKEPLFNKFKQLIDDEHYKLAEIFKDCLIYVGINDEFRAWANYA
jgi:hypothetical protein